jgi:carbamoyltransferase
MKILGIGGFTHDASATLIDNGKVIAAAEEERFTRQKHQAGWPTNAIDFCLKQGGLTKADIDHIAFYWRPWSLDSMKSHGRRLMQVPMHPLFSAGFLLNDMHDTGMYLFHLKQLKKATGGKAKIHFIDHHDTHGSVFFSSPYEEAAVLTIDSRGEWATSVWYHGKGNQMKRVGRINLPNSVGVVCLSTTNFLGFRTGDEYKVMGLASYGTPKYLDKFRQMYQLKDDGTYTIDSSFFKVQHSPGRYCGYVSDKFLKLFGPQREANAEITQDHMDIAASLQAALEEIVFHMLNKLYELTGCKNLCLSGGVVQNSVMTGRIKENTPFENIFMHSASGDNGCSMGAAYWVHNQVLKQERGEVYPSSYLGPEYTDEEIKAQLDIAKLPYTRPDSIVEATADCIAQGKIVGWFQGRMEWGARALGCRSILADVTNPEMTNIVNRYVKHREDFRPFAPACTLERASEFFEVDEPTPYMLYVVKARDAAKKRMPAIVHVDGSARLQTVERHQHSRFYELLEAMEQRKGVPCVLNTSFNIKGEPIVCSPKDAIECWSSTGIDSLVLGPYLIEKQKGEVERAA